MHTKPTSYTSYHVPTVPHRDLTETSQRLRDLTETKLPHRDLTETSQRPLRDLTETQLPHRNLTETSQRPHRKLLVSSYKVSLSFFELTIFLY